MVNNRNALDPRLHGMLTVLKHSEEPVRILRAWCTQCAFELTKEIELRGQELADAADDFQADVGKRHIKESNLKHIVRVQYSADLRQGSA